MRSSGTDRQRLARGPSGTLFRLPALGATLLLTLTACSSDELPTFAMPARDTTDQVPRILSLWQGSWIAALAVGVVVWGLIFWAVVAFRRRPGTTGLPPQTRYNLPVEVLYTVVPFVIIAVLFYYTVLSQNYVNELSDEAAGADRSSDDVIDIGVVGFQWNWQFNYVDEGVSVIGETGRPAQLVLPTGRTVRFTETSPDVIHSFWVPEWLFKRDVIPGRVNTFEITLKKTGEFVGRCTEFCGEKHAFMNFSLRVVEPDEYDSYISGLKADPNAALLTADSSDAAGSSS